MEAVLKKSLEVPLHACVTFIFQEVRVMVWPIFVSVNSYFAPFSFFFFKKNNLTKRMFKGRDGSVHSVV